MSEKKEYVLPKKTFTIEFFVGLFSILGLISLAYLTVNLANMKFFNDSGYRIIARFDNISGLKVGATVEIAGVEVGEVSSIDLSNGTSAKVVLNIRDGIAIRDDDNAAIRTKGIIGDRYVKIIPGGSEETLNPEDEIFDTESVVDFEDVIGKVIHSLDSSE